MKLSLLGCGLCVWLATTASAQAPKASLWCSDDVGRRIYRVSLDGNFVHSSFYSGSISGLAIDPVDGTIWAAKEGSSRIMHFDRLGRELGIIDAAIYDSVATRPEGVAVDFYDGSLWVVDDETARVYNLSRGGSLLMSFPTSLFDAASTSPQAVAADPDDGSLWITDNQADRVYNVTVAGELLSFFDTSVFAPDAKNCQGINVDESDGSLWITDRPTHRVYHVARDGALLGSFDTSGYGSNDPTGVVYDSFPTPDVPGLDRAGLFGVLGSKKVRIQGPGPEVRGHVALAPGARQVFKKGFIDGALFVDPSADNSHANEVVIKEGTIVEDLSLAAEELRSSAEGFAALPATQSFDRIHETTVIEGGAGLNVIDVQRIGLKGQQSLTLTGGVHARFVLNVHGPFRLKGAATLLIEGDVDPRNVIVNVLGKAGLRMSGQSTAVGTFLSAQGGRVKVLKDATLRGSVLGSDNVLVKKRGRIIYYGKQDG